MNTIGSNYVTYVGLGQASNHLEERVGDNNAEYVDCPAVIKALDEIKTAVANKKPKKPLNLKGADLRKADLFEADLRKADLRGADLREANLLGAILEGADLTGANLFEADLSGADLDRADLAQDGKTITGEELKEYLLKTFQGIVIDQSTKF